MASPCKTQMDRWFSQTNREEKGPGLALKAERERATFDVERMSEVIWGGARALKVRRDAFKLVESIPELRKWDYETLSRTQQHARNSERFVRYVEQVLGDARGGRAGQYPERKYPSPTSESGKVWARIALDSLLPVSLHHSMFIPTIMGQGSPAQVAKWLPMAQNYQIIGTYAQTELAHGSNVRGLETLARYDKDTREFVLHTPSISACKAWPGNLAMASNHCFVMARLVDGKGVDHGVHPFLCQIRDLKTHKPLPGVTLHDLGPKMGYKGMDNGLMRLTNVRIPADQLFARGVTFASDGSYIRQRRGKSAIGSKLRFGTMVFVRSLIVQDCSIQLARAATIAIRYSAVRKQFAKAGGRPGEENAVLNYETQQWRLVPLLAKAYAFRFTGMYMRQLYNKLMSADGIDASLLATVHASSSGLKSLTTWEAMAGMEECRQRLGGHGYLFAAGIAGPYLDKIPAVTYEGDNIILTFQTSKYLMKMLRRAKQGGELDKQLAYLSVKKHAMLDTDNLSVDALLAAFARRASHYVHLCLRTMATLVGRGLSVAEATEQNKLHMMYASVAHCEHLVLQLFVDKCRAMQGKQDCLAVLNTLCRCYALDRLYSNTAQFFECGALSQPGSVLTIRQTLRGVIKQLRPNLVALVDAWDFSDGYLNSALGRYDGNVYECLHALAQHSCMNQHMRENGAPPGFQKWLGPFMKSRL